METKEITENNKLIALFMGLTVNHSGVLIPNEYRHCNDHIRRLPKENGFYEGDISDLGYYYDWNLLMPVVEKIESLDNHGFTIYRKTTNINGLPIELANTRKSTKIEAVYNAVVEFIKWFNEQKLSHIEFDENGDNVIV